MNEKTLSARELLALRYPSVASEIKNEAHRVHRAVNQHYDKIHPYGYHLDMVVDVMLDYVDEVLFKEEDLIAIYFGAYFHDSIEDARLTYNDVLSTAHRYMDEERAVLAAEIVYALTNEKGRTRAERADERYYAGIRATPYAPFVKLADRIANMTYSFTHDTSGRNHHMLSTYRGELPHFIASITVAPSGRTGRCSQLPEAMVARLEKLLNN